MTLKDLNTQLADRAEAVCQQLLKNGKRVGREYVCGSTSGEAGKSLHVVLEGPKAGRWKDFAADEGGDMIALVQKSLGIDAIGAADWARGFLGLPSWEPNKSEPPPFDPLRFGFKRRDETEWRYGNAAWTYRDAEGKPVAYVVRFNRPDGGKDVMPIRMIDGKPKWKGYTGSEKRPLYNLHQLKARPDAPVLVVEGEKTADAAAKLFPAYVVLTWMGGTSNVAKTDWEPLLSPPRAAGITLWPDADEPGRKAMAYIAQGIPGAKRVRTDELPEKWDLADPCPDGINLQGLLDFAQVPDPETEKRQRKAAKESAAEGDERYHLPPGCELSSVEADILRYKVMEHANKVWSMRGNWATEVSNCTVHIHRHVPTKDGALSLVTLRNQNDGDTITLDVPFDVFSTSLSFTKWLGNQGNFQWWGTDGDFVNYKRRLMDLMKKCTLITELGTYEREGFFVFNDAAVNAEVYLLDPDGCFSYKDRWYYVPSGSAFYRDKPGDYALQKMVRFPGTSGIDFGTWSTQMGRVFHEHSYMAQAFTVATAFSDHIFKLIKGFPFMFYYGPGGSGKDQLIKACQAVFGDPQPEIFLTGPNTDKGLIKMFAEFTNIILNLAEYRKGMKKDMDELLKSLWGRIGYRLAAMRGKKTETIGIHCTAMVSGNDMPSDQALLRRMMLEVIEKREHTAQDVEEFQRLNEWQLAGYSGIFHEFYRHRGTFVAKWYQDYYKASRDIINEAMGETRVDSAIVVNMQVLHSVVRFFQQEAQLPFAFHADDLAGHMATCMGRQLEMRSEGSEVANFWTCFVWATRNGMLLENRDYKITGDQLMFYWGDVYAAYSAAHLRVFGERGERTTDMRSKLQRHPCYLEAPTSGRIGIRNSSAIVCHMERTGTNLKKLLASTADKFDTGIDTIGDEPSATQMTAF